MENEDRYEHIDILVKKPAEGDSWFDRIFDLISETCDSVEDENGEWSECSCGMQSMGGSEGTLDQCYEHMRLTETWAQDVRAEDLKILLDFADDSFKDTVQYERLRKAAYWHDDFNEWVANLPDDEEEDE